ncbi:collagen-like protein [Streptomyces sp. NPDC005970]|uniref:collagen-like protein n=1 Tax=Streptomyces sp. NPDC005970 TaxID=3156723 RepID=UPI0033DE5DDE
MTRTQRALVHRWRGIALACWLVAITGVVLLVWARIDSADHRGDQLAAEADRRGTAVSTLAGDVRALRAQVKAAGRTPVAPDPTQAVEDLPSRVKVPVPIPGPRGPSGPPGKATNGKDGKDGRAGKDGATGAPGADPTVPGPAGPAGPQGPAGPAGKDGQDGAPGADGTDGTDGQTCPDGYSLQAPSWDPDALVCRRSSAPQPSEPTPAPTTPAGLAPDRRRL